MATTATGGCDIPPLRFAHHHLICSLRTNEPRQEKQYSVDRLHRRSCGGRSGSLRLSVDQQMGQPTAVDHPRSRNREFGLRRILYLGDNAQAAPSGVGQNTCLSQYRMALSLYCHCLFSLEYNLGFWRHPQTRRGIICCVSWAY